MGNKFREFCIETKNNYIVHTLFLTDLQNFNPSK